MNDNTPNIVITGATDGIGLAAACKLAAIDSEILIVGRNEERCQAAVKHISVVSGNSNIYSKVADLSLVSDTHRVAGEIVNTFSVVDLLVHSAGGSFPYQRTLTSEGLEYTFALMYLARFYLTTQLLSPLLNASVPKVVLVAGGGSDSRRLNLDDLQSEKGYSLFSAIGKASSTNDLLTLALSENYEKIGFYNYGPGPVRTKTLMPNPLFRMLFSTFGRPFSRTAEEAADDLFGLVSGEREPGFYGPKLKQNEPKWGMSNSSLQEPLWKRSEEITSDILKLRRQ